MLLNTLAILFITFPVQLIKSLQCLKCEHVISPILCTGKTTCDPDEVCFLEKFKGEDEEILFNMGCKLRSKCNNQDGHGLNVCNSCCETDLCNYSGCGENFPNNSHGPVCLSCSQSRNPEKCDTISICAIGEVSYRRKKLFRHQVLQIGLHVTTWDCTDLMKMNKSSGEYIIHPGDSFEVRAYCDMGTDGGGWTIIQRRSERQVKFNRTWVNYENGFGNVNGEYWLGLKYVHLLTNSSKYELRVDMEDKNGQKIFAVYHTFRISDAASRYTITVGDYNGTAGDYLSNQNSVKFSTVDLDNTGSNHYPTNYGAWWYKPTSDTWLNSDTKENYWNDDIGRNTTMMIRKTQ